MWKQNIMSVHVLKTLLTRAKVYMGSFYIILAKQAMYRNHDTVRRVTVVNLKVQELQLQLESHAVSRDDANASGAPNEDIVQNHLT